MNDNTFTLAANSDETKTFKPGTYKVTTTGLSDINAEIYLRARNADDSAWDPAVLINSRNSGIIGAHSLTVNDNGIVNCFAVGLSDPSRVRVRLSP